MIYATSLAAELRKRRMEIQQKTGVKPTATAWGKPTPGASQDDAVIILDDDDDDDDQTSSNKTSAVDGNRLAVAASTMTTQGDAADKMTNSETKPSEGAMDQLTEPAASTIVDNAVLSCIPMPGQTANLTPPPVVEESKVPPLLSDIVLPVETKTEKQSPAVAPGEIVPVAAPCENMPDAALSVDHHPVAAVPTDAAGAVVTATVVSTANAIPTHSVSEVKHARTESEDQKSASEVNTSPMFRRLTELPMPPVVPDEEYDSLSEDCR